MRISEMVEGALREGHHVTEDTQKEINGRNEDDLVDKCNRNHEGTLRNNKEQETDGDGRKIVPDVLRHELNKIIYSGGGSTESPDDGKGSSTSSSDKSSSDDDDEEDEEEDEEEEEEENASDCSEEEEESESGSGGGLEVILEESEEEEESSCEEEWDSDATITGESFNGGVLLGQSGGGHAPGETGISTEKPEISENPDVPEFCWSLAQSRTGSSGPNTTTSDSSTTTTNTPGSVETSLNSVKLTQESVSTEVIPGNVPEIILNSLQDKSHVDATTDTNTDNAAPNSTTSLNLSLSSSPVKTTKTDDTNCNNNNPTLTNNNIYSNSTTPEKVKNSGKSVKFADELVTSLLGVKGHVVPVVVNDSAASPSSEYFVLKYLAEEQQKQLDLIDLTKFTGDKSSAAELFPTGRLDFDSGKELSQFIEANTAGSYFQDNNFSQGEMHQRLSSSCSEHQHLPPAPYSGPKPRGVLRKSGVKKQQGRNVSFNESLNLFYEAECQCWIHEDDYQRLRQEEHQHHQQLIYDQATSLHQLHHHHHHHGHNHHPHFVYEPPPLEFEDTPTLSPPEGYKDRFFPQTLHAHAQQQQLLQQQQQQQQDPQDPDVTRVSPPSPPSARRKVFLKENSTDQQQVHHHHGRPILNGLEEEEDDERGGKKSSRFGGILKGGRLWRSNSSESKKVSSPSEEPDVVKCTEKDRERLIDGDTSLSPGGTTGLQIQQGTQMDGQEQIYIPTKVSTGTATLRTSEQIRLAVDSTLRISRAKKNKQECSSLVEKLRWLTSLDDEDSSDSQSGFATWPSRDKNGVIAGPNSSSSRKSDAGTSTNEEFVHAPSMRHPVSANEAKIKQISYTLEDIDEGLKGSENELETFITEDGGRMERIRRRYGEDVGGDDYGFSRRPSVKGIKPKFSSTNQIFAQFTRAGAETPIPQMESQYENTRLPQNNNNAHYDPLPPTSCSGEIVGARVNLNYDQLPPPQANPNNSATNGPNGNNNAGAVPSVRPGPPGGTDDNTVRSSHFEMIRQSFEQASYTNYNRPHSWSVSTLPHNHTHGGGQPPNNGREQQQGTHPVGHVPLPGMTNNLSGSSMNIGPNQQQMVVVPSSQAGGGNGGGPQGQPQQPQNNLSNGAAPPPNSRPNSMPMMNPQQQQQLYGTLPHPSQGGQPILMMQQGQQMIQQGQQMIPGQMIQQVGPGGQPIYGTVRRVPNVIGRPLFLHYGALSVEAHPNKLPQPYPAAKVPETPSPTQQPPPIKYYGPPIRYYNPPPPVPPRSATTTIGGPGSGGGNGVPMMGSGDCVLERGNPEGATDEEPSIKEPYSMSMNV